MFSMALHRGAAGAPAATHARAPPAARQAGPTMAAAVHSHSRLPTGGRCVPRRRSAGFGEALTDISNKCGATSCSASLSVGPVEAIDAPQTLDVLGIGQVRAPPPPGRPGAGTKLWLWHASSRGGLTTQPPPAQAMMDLAVRVDDDLLSTLQLQRGGRRWAGRLGGQAGLLTTAASCMVHARPRIRMRTHPPMAPWAVADAGCSPASRSATRPSTAWAASTPR